MPTVSIENYLKALYLLQGEGQERRVKTKDLADHLNVSLPSVTGMLKALADDDYVEYQAYKGARLTDSGLRLALKVIRNHRLIEEFLVKTLGFSWDEVHAEAERLEHAVSDKLAERIDRFLSHPRFDPHGDPIPTAEGIIVERDVMPLSEALPQMHVRIERVVDQQPEVLRYLEQVGLMPNTTLIVMDVLPFDGQMFLKIGDDDAVISQVLASRLLVTQI